MPCDQILIFDASPLIDFKQRIGIRTQWWFFTDLLERVRKGIVVVPRQVARELERIEHPDMPGAWASGTFEESPHQTEPDYENVIRVMSSAGAVVDPDAEQDAADPWVVALGLQMMEAGWDVVVVTKDHINRPPRISLTEACRICGVPSMSVDEALEWLAIHPAN